MAELLSQAWLDEVRRLASGGPRPDVSARVRWVVRGGRGEGPRGRGAGAAGAETRFYMILDHGRPVEMMLGDIDDADVTFTVPYDDAVAVVRGELDLSVAFMQGRMKVEGDMGVLLTLLPAAETAEGSALLARIAGATTW